MPIYKNQSRTVAFQSLQTSGAPNTTVRPTVQISTNGNPASNTVAQPDHVSNGCWKLVLADFEMNGDLIVLLATADGCIPAQREFYTETDWNSARAQKLDNLDAAITSRSTFSGGPVLSVVSPVTVGNYSAGKDPASYVLKVPSQPLNTDASGNVSVFQNGDKNGYGLKPSDSGAIHAGPAAGGSATTITIVGGDSHDDLYVGNRIEIVAGTGYGQSRVIVGYLAASQTITVDRPWVVSPNASSSFVIKTASSARLDSTLNMTVGAYALGLDPATLLSASGYTSTRAAKLDMLDAAISSRSTFAGGFVAGVTNPVSVGSYTVDCNPATLMANAGFTTTRASFLDRLDSTVSSRLATANFVAAPTTSMIANAILSNSANKLSTSPSGFVRIDLDQPVPTTNLPQTSGDALNAARAQGFGAWMLNSAEQTLKLFAPDGTTVVRSFTLDSMVTPTSRV